MFRPRPPTGARYSAFDDLCEPQAGGLPVVGAVPLPKKGRAEGENIWQKPWLIMVNDG